MFHKKILALLMTLFSVLVTTACGVSIEGTYISQERPNDYLELRSDGTFFIMEKDRDCPAPITWMKTGWC